EAAGTGPARRGRRGDGGALWQGARCSGMIRSFHQGDVMKIQKGLLALCMLSLSFLTTGAFAKEDKATRQAEVQQKTQEAMERFYKVKPELKEAVAKAPGYGIFTTYGVSFVIGGSGGTGLVHDNHTKHTTYMK